MSLSTLSGLVDPEILNSSGEVDFFKLKFRDYKSLKDKLDNYCILNYVQLIKRNCPKVKLKPDKSNAHEVEHRVYESLYMTCIHYGQPRISNTNDTANQRPNQVYNACGCKCFFHYKWHEGSFYLFNYKKEHCNHPETKEHWESHPNQRRVSEEERVEIEKLFRLNVPFRNIRSETKDTTNKHISDHDLRNIASKQRQRDRPKVNPEDDVETEALKKLLETLRDKDTKNTIKTKVSDDGITPLALPSG